VAGSWEAKASNPSECTFTERQRAAAQRRSTGIPLDITIGRQDQRRDQVLRASCAPRTWRSVSGDDDRLAQPGQEERQRRGGVGHRIGPVQHHKAVVLLIIPLDCLGTLIQLSGVIFEESSSGSNSSTTNSAFPGSQLRHRPHLFLQIAARGEYPFAVRACRSFRGVSDEDAFGHE